MQHAQIQNEKKEHRYVLCMISRFEQWIRILPAKMVRDFSESISVTNRPRISFVFITCNHDDPSRSLRKPTTTTHRLIYDEKVQHACKTGGYSWLLFFTKEENGNNDGTSHALTNKTNYIYYIQFEFHVYLYQLTSCIKNSILLSSKT